MFSHAAARYCCRLILLLAYISLLADAILMLDIDCSLIYLICHYIDFRCHDIVSLRMLDFRHVIRYLR